ncbi:MAG: primase-helicase family protein [Candidatus Cryptobacteroides sp.]
MIRKEDIFNATEGGKMVITYYYPQSAACFGKSGNKNFRVRPDDRHPSCTVFRKDDIWFIQDKGGADTKARTAIQLVMQEEGLDFPRAIDWIAAKFAPQLCSTVAVPVAAASPSIEETTPQQHLTVMVRPSGEFTERELAQLGYNITQEVCAELLLKPVDYYITAANDKGKSYRIAANESYPIYYYDYGDWGKIYCPLGQTRFLYVGEKPSKFIFGEKEFIERYQNAVKGIYPGHIEADEEAPAVDLTWQDLVICSGPSDALNVKNAGYHVCWLNSETADLNDVDYSILAKLAKKLYILYDIDDTGLTNMYKIAMRYLDINIIRLPEELKSFKDRKGKPCKDAKDFFMYFRRPENQNPHSLFKELVKLAGGLKFWMEKHTKDGKFNGYEIDNEQLYSFLQATGFYRIASTSTQEGFTFCKVKDNIVNLIDKSAIASACAATMLEYIRTHAQYYSKTLANTIHRSRQISSSSLESLKSIEPNFNSYDNMSDYLFFRNGIFRITAKGVCKCKPADCDFMTYNDKIINHDFKPEDPFFDIEYTEEYSNLLLALKRANPLAPETVKLKRQLDSMTDTQRYKLRLLRSDCSFMNFVYNTGRIYWRKEEQGQELSDTEKTETNLNFINKVLALGYLMSKHKIPGQPYAIYAMETEQSDEGTHLGGTGKSLFMTSTERVRKQLFVNGQELDPNKMEFMLQGVIKGITDTVYYDDLHDGVDLHRFMPMITGKMVVNQKHKASFILEFSESPKVAFTSNHAIKKFDSSLRRRTWFTAFTDYYHPDNPRKGVWERSPYTEFGKSLIEDYDDNEMNMFYNFMLNCISAWQKIQTRVQPPMEQIERRNLQRVIGDEFIWWCEEYFTEDKLNCNVDKQQAFDDYKKTLPPRAADMMKSQTFKTKLQMFCDYKGWIFNPERLLVTDTEKKRNDIRDYKDGKTTYYFYIETPDADPGDLPEFE